MLAYPGQRTGAPPGPPGPKGIGGHPKDTCTLQAALQAAKAENSYGIRPFILLTIQAVVSKAVSAPFLQGWRDRAVRVEALNQQPPMAFPFFITSSVAFHFQYAHKEGFYTNRAILAKAQDFHIPHIPGLLRSRVAADGQALQVPTANLRFPYPRSSPCGPRRSDGGGPWPAFLTRGVGAAAAGKMATVREINQGLPKCRPALLHRPVSASIRGASVGPISPFPITGSRPP